MTNEELQIELTLLQTKISKANEDKNVELINKYVGELNKLWSRASVEMLKNAEADGIYPYNPLND